MKILHVVPTYLPATRYGGPIHSVHGLCRGLAEIGEAVSVLTTSVDGDRDSAVPHEQPVELDGVQVTYFKSSIGRRLYWAPAMERALERTIERFDIVHLHAVYLWPTNMAARVAQRAGVPYVISPRGMLVPELVSRKNAWIKSSWLTLIESLTLANAAHVHMTSLRELEDARRLPLPLPSPRIVPNGVHGPAPGFRDQVSDRARALIAEGPYVLFLGRVHWKKGLPRTIEALRGTPLRLLVCGPDDEGFADELRKLATDAGVAAQTRIEDSVAGADKWALLEAARCVVLASDNENFGNVVPEAMWMRTPVVVSDQTGASEVVRQAGCGLVCARTPEAVREALLELWSNDARRAAMGEAGERYARAHLTWRSVAEQMLFCYEGVLAGREGL
jgi:glycosyltransferase involved in cell wall biosynthesis